MDENRNGNSDEMLTEDGRRTMLYGLGRSFSFVGAEVPEEITLDGERIELRKIVVELASSDDSPPEGQRRIKLLRSLKSEIARKMTVLEDEELTVSDAEKICDEIRGLMRAAQSLDEEAGDISASGSDVEDARRWIEFLKKLGVR